MKKCLIAMLLSALMLMTCAAAATTNQQNSADALNSMGLFLGTDKGYELDKQLMRSDGITMLVRLLGKEADAKSGKYTHPFTDVLDWAKGYVGYAYENKITKGVNEEGTLFGYSMNMDSAQFLTLVLRTLGYTDGANGDFTWDKPYELAKKVGLIATTSDDGVFTRGEAVEIFWKALGVSAKGASKTFAKELIADGAFTQSAYDAAAKIQKNGKTPVSGGSTGGGSSRPSGGSSSGSGSSSGGSSASGYPASANGVTYADYSAMSGAEQGAFQKEFANTDTFFKWLGEVMAQHKDNDAEINDGGTIDLDRLG
jgi:uncharacterized membrane protein YgcG